MKAIGEFQQSPAHCPWESDTLEINGPMGVIPDREGGNFLTQRLDQKSGQFQGLLH
jgi:hypothetical protein